jgi:N-acetylglucosaminyl-diphospho-decaprenol L-rhamnosyltransferase
MAKVMASQDSSHPSARIAAITVSYGSLEVLPALLASIPAAGAQSIVVLVADNKADDADNAQAVSAQFGAQYVALPANVGYGSAINAAACRLPETIDWILVVNPDVVLVPGSVDELVATGDTDAAIGSVGPLTLTSEGDVYPSARSIPSLRTGLGHALFANLWLGNPWSRAYRNDTSVTSQQRDAGWLSGACVLVRRSAFDALGGFDEGYFMYFEDVDLGYRLGKAGYRNVYDPAAVVTHTGAHSTTSDSERMISAHHASAQRFLNRKYSAGWLWPVRVALTIGLHVRSALVRRRINRQ